MASGDRIDAPPVSLADRWRGLRDFLLSDRRFQRYAAAFPLTRPIARRRAQDLFDLCAGFVYSQILFACVKLDLFVMLGKEPQNAAALAVTAGIPLRAMTALLEAAASLQLLERRGDQRYGLGPLGAALRGNPGIAAMVEHHAALYADLADPLALLRGDRASANLASYWPYAAADRSSALTPDNVSPYTALMAASQPMVAEMVLAAYPFAKHRQLLDIGGGDGSFLVAAGRNAPTLKLQLFDLPAVADLAHQRLATEGLAHRASVVAGDFHSDPLPTGADAISLIRVVHDHEDDVVLNLLRRIRAALPADGVLIIGEPLATASGADPVGAYFNMYLLAMGSGRPRSFETLRGLLNKAGFDRVQQHPTRIPMIAQVIVAAS